MTPLDQIEPIKLPGGRLRCTAPECDGATFRGTQGWGAHSRIHKPAEQRLRTKPLGALAKRKVDCPLRGCDSRVFGSGLRAHLRERHPDISAVEAVAIVNGLADPPSPSTELDVVTPVRRGAAPPPRDGLPIEDAVTGMLMGMTGRDSIPLDRLPDVLRWAAATDRLVESLR